MYQPKRIINKDGQLYSHMDGTGFAQLGSLRSTTQLPFFGNATTGDGRGKTHGPRLRHLRKKAKGHWGHIFSSQGTWKKTEKIAAAASIVFCWSSYLKKTISLSLYLPLYRMSITNRTFDTIDINTWNLPKLPRLDYARVPLA